MFRIFRHNALADPSNDVWRTIFGFILFFVCLSSPAYALFEDKEKVALQEQVTQLRTELETVKGDRDNILKQAKSLLSEKETVSAELQKKEGSDVAFATERESLQKEIEILKSDVAKGKAKLLKERDRQTQELQAREKTIAELNAKNDSLAHVMTDYPPAKIQELLEDRNRLGEENKRMAARVLDMEKRMEEKDRALKPLELDREELYRLRSENKEMHKRIGYVTDLEKRQQQLLKENAEYREKVEIMKAKFKDAVPGLAKSGRISQKMMRENADMHYNLGTIFLNNKQYKEAIREYENVLELRPADPDTHYNLGVLYDDFLKDREKALYHYQKYLAISPRSPDAKKVESYILSLELEQKVR